MLRKKKTYPNLNSYDYSWFAREMTEEELYTVNGGQVMSQADVKSVERFLERIQQNPDDYYISVYERKALKPFFPKKTLTTHFQLILRLRIFFLITLMINQMWKTLIQHYIILLVLIHLENIME